MLEPISMPSSEATPQNDDGAEEWTYEPGDILGDRYEIVERLAQGAFGEVHAARDRTENRRVALKVLHPDSHLRDEKAVARMRQEAEILRALNHPNLVRVHDIVRDDDEEFMVMELLEGRSLRDLIDAGELAGEQRARPAVSQILAGLDAMHSRNVQHRDLKPDNIILRNEPKSPATDHVKLVDFGIAKAQDFLDQNHEFTLVQTRENEFVGTPRYASPEQAVGDPVGAPADLFSLGLVVAEWFTGVPRIEPEGYQGALSVLIQPDPIDVSDCPEAWQPWLEKMTAKSREERFQTAARAREELPGEDAETERYSKGRLERGFDPADLPSTEAPGDAERPRENRDDEAQLTADAAEGTPDGTAPHPAIGSPGDPEEPTEVTSPPREVDAVAASDAPAQAESAGGTPPPDRESSPDATDAPETPPPAQGGRTRASARSESPSTPNPSTGPDHSESERPGSDSTPGPTRTPRRQRSRPKRNIAVDDETQTQDANRSSPLPRNIRLRTIGAVVFFLVSLAIFGYSLYLLFQS